MIQLLVASVHPFVIFKSIISVKFHEIALPGWPLPGVPPALNLDLELSVTDELLVLRI